MKDITFRSPPGWYLALAETERAKELRVIDLVSACTAWHETGRLVRTLAVRTEDASYAFLGSTLGSVGTYRVFQPGDYVLVAAFKAAQGAAETFKTGFVEATRSAGSGYDADVTFLDGTKGTYQYNRMIWAQIPGPLKALMDRKVCVENCPLKDEGACMRKGDE